VEVRAQSAAGEPLPGSVALVRIDETTGMPMPPRQLGDLPLPPASLPPGMYRFVFTLPGHEQRELTRTTDGMQQTLQVTCVVRDRPRTEGMVRIDGGPLRLPENGPPHGLQHVTAPVQPFLLDRCEVTNGEYRAFLEGTGHPPPLHWQLLDDRKYEDHPVVMVSWDDAVAYAEWAGKRLPTYPEWVVAACGTGLRRFPYAGSDYRGAVRGTKLTGGTMLEQFAGYADGTTAVAANPQACTPEGVFEMLGNVEEWTESIGVDHTGARLFADMSCREVAGSYWAAAAEHDVLPTTTFGRSGPTNTSMRRGFRCARSL
jgi:formylglycine-generating enzyme required for sulfatase activity